MQEVQESDLINQESDQSLWPLFLVFSNYLHGVGEMQMLKMFEKKRAQNDLKKKFFHNLLKKFVVYLYLGDEVPGFA